MKPPGARWYVINTQPRSESRAEGNLAGQGFPTYMPRCWRAVRHARRTKKVLAGEEPVALPDKVVEDIHAREDDDGYVRLGLPAGVRAGSPVRLVEGLFADHRGICERVADEARVAILLELLGRQVRVFVPAGSVAAA